MGERERGGEDSSGKNRTKEGICKNNVKYGIN